MSSNNKEREDVHETSSARERETGTRILERVRRTVNEAWPDTEHELGADAFTLLYLKERDSSVPEWFLGDEIMDDIIDLFYNPVAAMRDELAEGRGVWPGEMPVYVMPSWQSYTFAAVLTKDRVLMHLERKASGLWWRAEDDMALELGQWYRAAERGLLEPSSLSAEDRQALREVLGQVAVLLPGSKRVRVVDRELLHSAVKRLRRLI